MWDGMINGMLTGISTTMVPMNIGMVLFGCFMGSLIGMLPGLGPITAVALMIPVTYGLEPSTGMVLLAGVYYGAIFGGSTSSILINAPGEAATVATALDGYPLARQGYPGKALAVAAYASFSGGTISVIMLMFFAPMLASVATSFQSADYFALMILGLTAVSAFAGRGGVLKALLMVVLGLMLATVGTDQTSGVQRFTFGSLELLDGIEFLLLAMATFALTEALSIVLKRDESSDSLKPKMIGFKSLKVTKEEFKQIGPTIGRSSLLGFRKLTWLGCSGGWQQRCQFRFFCATALPRHSRFGYHGCDARCTDRLRNRAGATDVHRKPRGLLGRDHVNVSR
jgi:putative tricarboxylic transport membrane protein